MYIEHLTVENYKGFKRETFDFRRADGEYAGWHVLAGPNGSGKSSVLTAIALALRAKDYAYRLLPTFEGQLRAGAQEGVITLRLLHEMGVDKFEEERTFFLSRADAEHPHSGWSFTDDDENFPQREIPAHLEFGLSMRARSSGAVHALKQDSDNYYPSWAERGPWLAQPGGGWMIAAYGPQRRMEGHSNHALELMRERSGVASLVTLFRDDASLAEATVWLRELRDADAPIAVEDLIGLLNDGLLPGDVVAMGLDADGLLQVEQAGLDLPLASLSDGYRSVAALVFDIVYRLSVAYGRCELSRDQVEPGSSARYVCPQPGVVLIDEAETHLHPSWQQRLGFWLTEHFPRVQFIVTTHSPFICQAAVAGSLTRLSPPGATEAAGPLDDGEFWTVVNGSADEAMRSRLFGLRQVISSRSEALRDEVARLEVKQLDEALGTEERERLEQARRQLPRQPSAKVDALARLLTKID